MDDGDLRDRLLALDSLETQARDTDEAIESHRGFRLSQRDYQGKPMTVFDTVATNVVTISRMSRFVSMPLHVQRYVGIYYVYSGSCTLEVPDGTYVLPERGLVILDKNVCHRLLPLGEQDIVISITIKRKFLTPDVMSSLVKTSALMEFLLRACSPNSSHQNRIWYLQPAEEVSSTIGLMLVENVDPGENADTIIRVCAQLLLQYLSREKESETNLTYGGRGRGDLDPEAIGAYIKRNYATCTLDDLAREFGYNSHYISVILKKYKGRTFRDIVMGERLERAKLLLDTTALPVTKIIEITGFSGATFFYRKFRERYGVPLSEYPRPVTDNAGK